jgi:hypothetical protein
VVTLIVVSLVWGMSTIDGVGGQCAEIRPVGSECQLVPDNHEKPCFPLFSKSLGDLDCRLVEQRENTHRYDMG